MRGVRGRKVLGHIEHPEDGRTDLLKAAIVITDINMRESGEVVGTLETLGTPHGKIAAALFKDGITVGISSRGRGSVVQRDDGVDEVQDDYVMETFDLVADPSTYGAELVMTEGADKGKTVHTLNEGVMKTLEEAKQFSEKEMDKLTEDACRKLVMEEAKAISRNPMRAFLVKVEGPEYATKATMESLSCAGLKYGVLSIEKNGFTYIIEAKTKDALIEAVSNGARKAANDNKISGELFRTVEGAFHGNPDVDPKVSIEESKEFCPVKLVLESFKETFNSKDEDYDEIVTALDGASAEMDAEEDEETPADETPAEEPPAEEPVVADDGDGVVDDPVEEDDDGVVDDTTPEPEEPVTEEDPEALMGTDEPAEAPMEQEEPEDMPVDDEPEEEYDVEYADTDEGKTHLRGKLVDGFETLPVYEKVTQQQVASDPRYAKAIKKWMGMDLAKRAAALVKAGGTKFLNTAKTFLASVEREPDGGFLDAAGLVSINNNSFRDLIVALESAETVDEAFAKSKYVPDRVSKWKKVANGDFIHETPLGMFFIEPKGSEWTVRFVGNAKFNQRIPATGQGARKKFIGTTYKTADDAAAKASNWYFGQVGLESVENIEEKVFFGGNNNGTSDVFFDQLREPAKFVREIEKNRSVLGAIQKADDHVQVEFKKGTHLQARKDIIDAAAKSIGSDFVESVAINHVDAGPTLQVEFDSEADAQSFNDGYEGPGEREFISNRVMAIRFDSKLTPKKAEKEIRKFVGESKAKITEAVWNTSPKPLWRVSLVFDEPSELKKLVDHIQRSRSEVVSIDILNPRELDIVTPTWIHKSREAMRWLERLVSQAGVESDLTDSVKTISVYEEFGTRLFGKDKRGVQAHAVDVFTQRKVVARAKNEGAASQAARFFNRLVKEGKAPKFIVSVDVPSRGDSALLPGSNDAFYFDIAGSVSDSAAISEINKMISKHGFDESVRTTYKVVTENIDPFGRKMRSLKHMAEGFADSYMVLQVEIQLDEIPLDKREAFDVFRHGDELTNVSGALQARFIEDELEFDDAYVFWGDEGSDTIVIEIESPVGSSIPKMNSAIKSALEVKAIEVTESTKKVSENATKVAFSTSGKDITFKFFDAEGQHAVPAEAILSDLMAYSESLPLVASNGNVTVRTISKKELAALLGAEKEVGEGTFHVASASDDDDDYEVDVDVDTDDEEGEGEFDIEITTGDDDDAEDDFDVEIEDGWKKDETDADDQPEPEERPEYDPETQSAVAQAGKDQTIDVEQDPEVDIDADLGEASFKDIPKIAWGIGPGGRKTIEKGDVVYTFSTDLKDLVKQTVIVPPNPVTGTMLTKNQFGNQRTLKPGEWARNPTDVPDLPLYKRFFDSSGFPLESVEGVDEASAYKTNGPVIQVVFGPRDSLMPMRNMLMKELRGDIKSLAPGNGGKSLLVIFNDNFTPNGALALVDAALRKGGQFEATATIETDSGDVMGGEGPASNASPFRGPALSSDPDKEDELGGEFVDDDDPKELGEAEKFLDARSRILKGLVDAGWDVVGSNMGRPLKFPHATDGDLRLYFKAQSVYFDFGPPFSMNNAHSMVSDIRGLPVDRIIRSAERARQSKGVYEDGESANESISEGVTPAMIDSLHVSEVVVIVATIALKPAARLENVKHYLGMGPAAYRAARENLAKRGILNSSGGRSSETQKAYDMLVSSNRISRDYSSQLPNLKAEYKAASKPPFEDPGAPDKSPKVMLFRIKKNDRKPRMAALVTGKNDQNIEFFKRQADKGNGKTFVVKASTAEIGRTKIATFRRGINDQFVEDPVNMNVWLDKDLPGEYLPRRESVDEAHVQTDIEVKVFPIVKADLLALNNTLRGTKGYSGGYYKGDTGYVTFSPMADPIQTHKTVRAAVERIGLKAEHVELAEQPVVMRTARVAVDEWLIFPFFGRMESKFITDLPRTTVDNIAALIARDSAVVDLQINSLPGGKSEVFVKTRSGTNTRQVEAAVRGAFMKSGNANLGRPEVLPESKEMTEANKLSPKQHYKAVMQRIGRTMPTIDPDEYPPMSGLEGPFRFRNGRIAYYDPREGAYYDPKSDLYLELKDIGESLEEAEYRPYVQSTMTVVFVRGDREDLDALTNILYKDRSSGYASSSYDRAQSRTEFRFMGNVTPKEARARIEKEIKGFYESLTVESAKTVTLDERRIEVEFTGDATVDLIRAIIQDLKHTTEWKNADAHSREQVLRDIGIRIRRQGKGSLSRWYIDSLEQHTGNKYVLFTPVDHKPTYKPSLWLPLFKREINESVEEATVMVRGEPMRVLSRQPIDAEDISSDYRDRNRYTKLPTSGRYEFVVTERPQGGRPGQDAVLMFLFKNGKPVVELGSHTSASNALGFFNNSFMENVEEASGPFEKWMRDVDLEVQKMIGLSVHDLPDVPFRDWYANRMNAKAAARKAIKMADSVEKDGSNLREGTYTQLETGANQNPAAMLLDAAMEDMRNGFFKTAEWAQWGKSDRARIISALGDMVIREEQGDKIRWSLNGLRGQTNKTYVTFTPAEFDPQVPSAEDILKRYSDDVENGSSVVTVTVFDNAGEIQREEIDALARKNGGTFRDGSYEGTMELNYWFRSVSSAQQFADDVNLIIPVGSGNQATVEESVSEAQTPVVYFYQKRGKVEVRNAGYTGEILDVVPIVGNNIKSAMLEAKQIAMDLGFEKYDTGFDTGFLKNFMIEGVLFRNASERSGGLSVEVQFDEDAAAFAKAISRHDGVAEATVSSQNLNLAYVKFNENVDVDLADKIVKTALSQVGISEGMNKIFQFDSGGNARKFAMMVTKRFRLQTQVSPSADPEAKTVMVKSIPLRDLIDLDYESSQLGGTMMESKLPTLREATENAPLNGANMAEFKKLLSENASLKAEKNSLTAQLDSSHKENEILRDLNEEMANLQHAETLKDHQETIFKKYPDLKPLSEEFDRCETVEELDSLAERMNNLRIQTALVESKDSGAEKGKESGLEKPLTEARKSPDGIPSPTSVEDTDKTGLSFTEANAEGSQADNPVSRFARHKARSRR